MKLCVTGITIKLEYPLFLVISLALLLGYDNILYLILFSSLHEFGHLVSLYLLGGRPDEITASYYGIALKYSNVLKPLPEIAFLLSGIAVNAAFCAFNVRFEINFALALINALPLYPLDGGRALRVALNCVLPYRISDRIMISLSVIFVCLLFAVGIFYKNISLILITMYIIFYSINYKRFV